MAAATPALGLSNKAIFEGQTNLSEDPAFKIQDDEEGGFGDEEPQQMELKAIVLEQPPFEEHLLQNTLWAEIEKLYGHPYEIFSLASDRSGNYLASSCKVMNDL